MERHALLLLLLIFSFLQGRQCARDFTGCCTRLLIESDMNEEYGGEYNYVSVYYDHQEHKHVNKDMYLLFLQDKWLIASDYDGFDGIFSNSGSELCVEDVDDSEWKVIDGKNMPTNIKLNITCNERQVEDTKCMYRQGVKLEGGDLPEDFGGGGMVTNNSTYIDCLQQCQHRSGFKHIFCYLT